MVTVKGKTELPGSSGSLCVSMSLYELFFCFFFKFCYQLDLFCMPYKLISVMEILNVLAYHF